MARIAKQVTFKTVLDGTCFFAVFFCGTGAKNRIAMYEFIKPIFYPLKTVLINKHDGTYHCSHLSKLKPTQYGPTAALLPIARMNNTNQLKNKSALKPLYVPSIPTPKKLAILTEPFLPYP